MNPLSYLKIGGTLIGLIALASVLWLARDRFAQKEIADNARDCAAVAFKMEGALDPCLPEVRSAIEARRQAESCDDALAAENALAATALYGIRMACSSEVKQIHAERAAALDNLSDAERRLAEQKASTIDAVARAEARATTITKRKINASQAIEAAPRGDDGLAVCDADCLRNIAG